MAAGEKLSIYLKSSGAGLVSQVVTKLSAFAAVWLLNQILLKEAYGDYEFALALVSMLLILGSGGLQYVAMYRLSRIDAEPETLAGQKLAGALLGWSTILSVVVALGVAYLAPVVASASGKPELAYWIGSLAFLIPIRVALGIYKDWYRARQLVAESLFLGDVGPAITRTFFLAGAWFVWQTPEGVVAAILLGEFIPLAIWFLQAPLNPFRLTGILSRWDIQYAVKLMFTRSLSKSLKRSDVIMMGALASSGATAGYVVASKLSMLLLVGHQLMNLILTPRIGRFLSNKDIGAVHEEYHQSRVVGLTFAMFGACFISLTGPWILEMFGNYGGAMPVLLILSAAYVSQVSFGMCGGYLNIAGYAGFTLMTTGLVLVLNIGLNYLLIPVLAASGAALAMLLSVTVTNSFTAYLVLRFDNVQTYSFWVGLVTASSIGVLIAAAFDVISYPKAGLTLVSLVGVFFWSERRFVLSLFSVLSDNLLSNNLKTRVR